MADKSILFRDYSAGINVLDDPYIIKDNQLVIALNMDLVRGGVRIRSGITLFNNDSSKSGGIKHMLPFYKPGGSIKQMIFANSDKWYYLTAAATTSTAWSLLQDMGTASDNPRGHVYDAQAVLGSGVAADSLYVWDGTTASAASLQPSSGALNIFEFMQAYDFSALFGALEGTSVVHYCQTDDPDKWTGGSSDTFTVGKDDGETIRGMKAQGSYLWVIKDTKKYPVKIEWDSASSSFLPRVQSAVDQSGGTIAHDSIKVVTAGHGDDLYMLSRKGEGIQSFGIPANFSDSPIPLPVSELINPIINKINWDNAHLARAIVWKRKYMLAVPYGPGATYNNLVFVRHLDTQGWTIYDNWKVGAWCIFKDSNGIDQLYFGDAVNPNIYILKDNTYTDNLFPYSSEILTGKRSADDFSTYKTFYYLDIFGKLSEGAELEVTIYIDNQLISRYRIDESFTVGENEDSFLGSEFIGSDYLGGSVDSGERLFLARLPINDDLKYGRTIQLGLRNTGLSWALTGEKIWYNLKDEKSTIPDKFIVKNTF